MREQPVEGDRGEEEVLGDRELRPREQELERGQEGEAERARQIRIRPTTLCPALVASSIQRGAALAGKPSTTGTGVGAHGVYSCSISSSTGSWAAWMSAFWVSTKALVLVGGDHVDLGLHSSRMPGP